MPSKIMFNPCGNCCTELGELIIQTQNFGSNETLNVINFLDKPNFSLLPDSSLDLLSTSIALGSTFLFSGNYVYNFTGYSNCVISRMPFPSGSLVGNNLSSHFPDRSDANSALSRRRHSFAQHMQDGKILGFWSKSDTYQGNNSPFGGTLNPLDGTGANYSIDSETLAIVDEPFDFRQQEQWDLIRPLGLLLTVRGPTSPAFNLPPGTYSIDVDIPGVLESQTFTFTKTSTTGGVQIAVPLIVDTDRDSFVSTVRRTPAIVDSNMIPAAAQLGFSHPQVTITEARFWVWQQGVTINASTSSSGVTVTTSLYLHGLGNGTLNALSGGNLFPSFTKIVHSPTSATFEIRESPGNANFSFRYLNDFGLVVGYDYDPINNEHYYLVDYNLLPGVIQMSHPQRIYKFDNDQNYLGYTVCLGADGLGKDAQFGGAGDNTFSMRGLAFLNNKLYSVGAPLASGGTTTLYQHTFGTNNATGQWRHPKFGRNLGLWAI